MSTFVRIRYLGHDFLYITYLPNFHIITLIDFTWQLAMTNVCLNAL